MINKKSFNQIQQEAIKHLAENTGITQMGAGGAARSLVDVFSRHLADFYTRLDIDLSMAYITTATGFYLDLLGKLFGVSRRQNSETPVLAEDKVLKFYAPEGMLLSDFLPGLSIGAGTRIKTADETVIYAVSETANFLQMDDHVFVSATPVSSPVYKKAGAGTMTMHNLTETQVLVTNLSALSVGSTLESDSDYRARIATSNTARAGSNESAVRLAALGSDQVADVSISEFARGSGSFEVMVIPTGNRVPSASMDEIRGNINGVVAYGVSFDVREPDYVQLKLEMRVKFDSTVSEGNQASALRQIEADILAYIGNLRPGAELSMSRLQSVALGTSNVTDAVVTYLCIDKKEQIVRNVRLEDDEMFIPDEDTANPIVIRT